MVIVSFVCNECESRSCCLVHGTLKCKFFSFFCPRNVNLYGYGVVRLVESWRDKMWCDFNP